MTKLKLLTSKSETYHISLNVNEKENSALVLDVSSLRANCRFRNNIPAFVNFHENLGRKKNVSLEGKNKSVKTPFRLLE